ncbi:Fructose-bisphosphate aldolase 1 chloroplastic [Bienertia sinuspersici]
MAGRVPYTDLWIRYPTADGEWTEVIEMAAPAERLAVNSFPADFNAKSIASPRRGILAMDELKATCGKRLASIGLCSVQLI